MNIQELAAKLNTSQSMVENLLSGSGFSINEVDDGVVELLRSELAKSSLTPVNKAIEKKEPTPAPKAQPKQVAPATPSAAAPSGQAPRTAQEVKNRRQSATVDVLSTSSDTVAEVLETAKAIAAQKLLARKQEMAEKIAEQLVDQTEAELNDATAFLLQYLQVGGQQALQPWRQTIESEETLEAELVA